MKQLLIKLRIWLLGSLGTVLLFLLYLTLRKRFVISPQVDLNDPAPKIWAFWHRRQLVLPRFYQRFLRTHKMGFYMLISAHTDGRIIATAVRPYGIRSIAGSSTRGGQEAFLALVERLQAGSDVGITPDGPKGPPFKCKPGVLALAARTGTRIYSLSYGAERVWQFRSWDRMILPKPFSRAVFYAGPPFRPVPPDLSGEEFDRARAEFDAWLMETERFVDSYNYDA